MIIFSLFGLQDLPVRCAAQESYWRSVTCKLLPSWHHAQTQANYGNIEMSLDLLGGISREQANVRHGGHFPSLPINRQQVDVEP